MHQVSYDVVRRTGSCCYKLFILFSLFIVHANSDDYAQNLGLNRVLFEDSSDHFNNALSKTFKPSVEEFDPSDETVSVDHFRTNSIPEKSNFFEGIFNLLQGTKTTCQLAQNDGFLCEEHEAETLDGYIITIHRIPGGSCLDRSKVPVLLVHGLLGSSADWTLLGKYRALAYLLADSCRDVWMMDFRGNTYSKKHAYLNSSAPEYWNWTHHEMGMYDIPAVIDYVLKKTNHSQLNYVGYSLGNTLLLITCSMLPQYNDKIRVFVALAPVAFLGHSQSLFGTLAYHTKVLADLLDSMGTHSFLQRTFSLDRSVKLVCATGTLTRACDLTLFKIMGYDPDQLTQDMTKKYFSHNPTGTSTKTMRHLACSVTNGTFAQYNYGESGNLKLYNSTSPPDYPLEKITAHTILMYGLNDILSVPKDVFNLYEKLVSKKQLIQVNYTQFSHSDFTTAKDAKTLVYDKVLEILNNED